MDDHIGWIGALLIGVFLVGAFFVFSHKIGAMRAFGRHPLSWRKLGLLSLAGFLPCIGCMSSAYMCTWPYVLEHPSLMAMGMATVGWLGWKALLGLETFAMAECSERAAEPSQE